MTVLFLVGEPGCGKTTLARRMLDADSYLVQTPKWTVGHSVCAAGHYSGGAFDGADTVPYNGVNAALTFWERELYKLSLTLFDGDRFSNAAVVDRVKQVGNRVRCVRLHLPADVAAERRRLRGSNQNASWVKGRETKSARFALLPAFDSAMDLSAELSTDAMLPLVRAFVSDGAP